MKLWSHAVAQSLAGLSPSEQALAREILSTRYGPRAVTVLPLRGGDWAVFSGGRQLAGTCSDEELPQLVRQVVAEEERASERRREAEQAQTPGRVSAGALSDLI